MPVINTERKLTVMPRPKIELPALYLDVYVQADKFESSLFAVLFSRAMCRRAKTLDQADLVVFGGGPDVDPAIYGGTPPHPTVHFEPSRDESDINLYLEATSKGIPLMGVCRGAQLIWALMGGTLYQDVDGHHGAHGIWDLETKNMHFDVSSVHHQMCKGPAPADGIIIAEANKTSRRSVNAKITETSKSIYEIEAYFLPTIAAIGFQGHPEYSGYDTYAKWAMDKVNRHIVQNDNIKLIGGYRRVVDLAKVPAVPNRAVVLS